MNPHFIIDKPISMNDEKISILLKGVPANSVITITAESSNFYCINALPNIGIGTTWLSSCDFLSSSKGEINLNTNASLSGNYKGINSMGIFYSMRPEKIVREKKKMKLSDIPVLKKYNVLLSAYKGSEKLCDLSIIRAYQKNNIAYHDYYGKDFVARFFKSKDQTNLPTIIVLSGSDGRIEKAQSIAQQLTIHGFNALAVCYFGLNEVSKSLSKIPIEIIKESIAFLKKQDCVNNKKIGIYGRSKGGEFALLVASIFSDLSCVVANTPSGFVFEGLNEKNKRSHSSTWTYHGGCVPYIRFRMMPFIPYILGKLLLKKSDLTKVYLKLLNHEAYNQARIIVENIKGPILLISSVNDEVWPSTLFCDIITKQLKKKNYPYKFEHITYQNSGHFLTIAYQPNPRYTPENCLNRLAEEIDSWEKTISFFKNWAKT